MRRAQQSPADENAGRGGKKRRQSDAPSSTVDTAAPLPPLVPTAPSVVSLPIQLASNPHSSVTIVTLDADTLVTATKVLAARDPDLASIFSSFGPPPLWARAPGFPTLIHIILEQQVSLASANATFNRLKAAIDPVTPQAFLTLDDSQLLTIGFSRQKAAYSRGLASALIDGRLDLSSLATHSDELVRATLTQLKGIGPWTANIYLLMALLRADVWPQGDLALASAVQQVKRLSKRPNTEDLAAMSEAWRPYRAVAARLFWHHYLSVRKPKGTE